MAKDLFSSLQKIAAEAKGSISTNDTGNEKLIDSQDISKIQNATQIANDMYPDHAAKRFDYWKKSVSLDGMSNNARNEYWKTYEKMHPRGLDGAKSDFINVTLNEVGLVNGVSNKEFLLRDRISKLIKVIKGRNAVMFDLEAVVIERVAAEIDTRYFFFVIELNDQRPRSYVAYTRWWNFHRDRQVAK